MRQTKYSHSNNLTAILIALDLHALLALPRSMYAPIEVDSGSRSAAIIILFDLNIAFMHIAQNAYQFI